MNIFVDIDKTICITDELKENKYNFSVPIPHAIKHINDLYKKGNTITYWTARGNASGNDYTDITVQQLKDWGCLYHELRYGKTII
jgi:hypothetical protein